MNEEEKKELDTDKASQDVDSSKTYTTEEVEAIKTQIKEENEKNFQDKFDKRWGKEKKRIEERQSKENELIDLLKEQTKARDIDELLDMSYRQYKKERPVHENKREAEILGNADAKEILELEDNEIEAELDKLQNKKRTAREEATYSKLNEFIANKKYETKLAQEIKENGIDESLVKDEKFKEFQEKFDKSTSIKDIVDIYSKVNGKQKPFSAGSLKTDGMREEDELFTLEQFQSLTDEDLKNPKIFEKAMKSRLNFK